MECFISCLSNGPRTEAAKPARRILRAALRPPIPTMRISFENVRVVEDASGGDAGAGEGDRRRFEGTSRRRKSSTDGEGALLEEGWT